MIPPAKEQIFLDSLFQTCEASFRGWSWIFSRSSSLPQELTEINDIHFLVAVCRHLVSLGQGQNQFRLGENNSDSIVDSEIVHDLNLARAIEARFGPISLTNTVR